tara:strand:+ start:1825 stop:2058 length:234 start_codon:yes stop_codon:yes gene_type:complete
MKMKKNKSCAYDNMRCFNLEEALEEDKKVVAKDVFEGYSAKNSQKKSKITSKKSPKRTNPPKPTKKTVSNTRKKKKY